MANGYVPIQYPSWVYPSDEAEIPVVVTSLAQAQAIVVAPTPSSPVTIPTTSVVPTKTTAFSGAPSRPMKQKGK